MVALRVPSSTRQMQRMHSWSQLTAAHLQRRSTVMSQLSSDPTLVSSAMYFSNSRSNLTALEVQIW